jgi:hypothetical protein
MRMCVPKMSKLKLLVFTRCVAVGLCVTWCCALPSYAQSGVEDEQLVAAERALLEGLASNGGNAFQAPPAQAEPKEVELQPATYSGPVTKPQRGASDGTATLEERDLAPVTNPKPKRIAEKQQQETDGESVEPQHVALEPVPHPHNPALKRELEASQAGRRT